MPTFYSLSPLFDGSVTTAKLAALSVTTAKIAADAVTFAKMLNSTAASVLIGRGSAAGAGDFEEITLGANLTMTGTSLAASAGSGALTFLSKQTLGANTTTVTFATLTSNAYILKVRTYSTVNPSVFYCELNDDATAGNYFSSQHYWTGANGGNTSANTAAGFALVGNGGWQDITIFIFKDVTTNHASWSGTFGGEDDYLAGNSAGGWKNTTAKITKMDLTLQSGDFISGSVFTLYSVQTE